MHYFALKHLHVTCVVLSILGFLIRTRWAFSRSPRLSAKWVRIFPHMIDTGLLLSGLGMLFELGLLQSPPAWAWTKIGGLLIYIGAGKICLAKNTPLPLRRRAFFVAIGALSVIVCAAFTKNPLSFFGLLIQRQ